MNVLFLAGGHLLKYVGHCFIRKKTLTGVLNGSVESHCGLAVQRPPENHYELAVQGSEAALEDQQLTARRDCYSRGSHV